MKLDLSAAEDAFLDGSVDFDEWRAEFEQAFFAPLAASIAGALVQGLSGMGLGGSNGESKL